MKTCEAITLELRDLQDRITNKKRRDSITCDKLEYLTGFNRITIHRAINRLGKFNNFNVIEKLEELGLINPIKHLQEKKQWTMQ